MRVDFIVKQTQIRDNVKKLCDGLGHRHGLEREIDGEFPQTCCRATADYGFAAIAIPAR